MTTLNKKEKTLIKLICDGKSSKEIGEILFKSPRTVEGYVSDLYEKLDVKNKAELISYAFKNKLV